MKNTLTNLWDRLTATGLKPDIPPKERIKIKILNQILLSYFIVCLITSPLFYFLDSGFIFWSTFISLLIISMMFFFNSRGWVQLSWHLGLILVPLFITYNSIAYRPIFGGMILILAFVPTFHYFFTSNLIRFVYYLYYCSATIAILLIGFKLPPSDLLSFQANLIVNVIILLMGLSIIILQSVIFVHEMSTREDSLVANELQIKQLLQEVNKKNEELEEKVNERTASLEAKNLELLRSNQDLEQFAYIASHDLKEPLRTISSFIQLLSRKEKKQLNKESKEYLEFAADASKRMANQIQALLQYSRVGRLNHSFKQTRLLAVVQLKLHDLQALIDDKKAHIEINSLPGVICCDPQLIGMVFYNLISNGLRFNNSPQQPIIRIESIELEDFWKFKVSDNGIGIAPEFHQKIFDIFKTLHPKHQYKGTGIGLALCNKIVGLHKGKIWVDSQVGEGSDFFFTISKKLKSD